MQSHHTKNKGDLGVLKAKADICQQGFLVLSPESEHSPFDLVAYKNNCFLRIQVKYRSLSNGSITVNKKSVWSDSNGIHTSLSAVEFIDFYCIYNPELDKCFYISKQTIKKMTTFRLRVNPAKNNQKSGVRLAKDFESLDLQIKTTYEHV